MRIDEGAIPYLKRATVFACDAKNMMRDISAEAVIRSLPLQNALIFCLKALGVCLDKAARIMRIDFSAGLSHEQQLPRDTLIFWCNIHFLRNVLIHHFDANMLHGFRIRPDEQVTFYKLCRNMGQVEFYLRAIISQGKTDIDLKGQRFKVFVEFHVLAELLRAHNPREARTRITQAQYLQAMTDALCIIANKIIGEREINEALMRSMRRDSIRFYYALQNLLECVATLGNPNPFGEGTQLVDDASRSAIFSIDSRAEAWMRNLGTSRIMAIHESALAVISDQDVVRNLREMQLLRRALLDPAMETTVLGIRLQDQFIQRAVPPQPEASAADGGDRAGESGESSRDPRPPGMS